LAGAARVGAARYQPRAVEGTVLHRIVRENVETFLREATDTDRDISELPSEHVGDTDDVMPIGKKGIGQVATEGARHSRDEDPLRTHGLTRERRYPKVH